MSNKKNLAADNFGSRLQSYRMAKGLTGKQLADIIGISQGSLSELENGKREPSGKVFYGIAKNTDIDLKWLITGKTPKKLDKEKNINPLLVDVNVWLNEGKKHESAEFRILFEQQMIRAFFDYEDWKRKRDKAESGESEFPASKVA